MLPDMTESNTDGGSVVLRRVAINLDSDVGAAFVCDCVRHIEGLIGAEQLRKKYELDDLGWTGLAANEPLQRLVGREKEKRIRRGEAAREKAAHYFTQAPDVLNSILHDPAASPRHKIESARELRQVATPAAETTPAGDRERFVIRIDFSSGGKKDNVIVRSFDKPLTPAHDENEPIELEAKPLKRIEPTLEEDDHEPPEYDRI
jgi:hypothetical protein